MKPSDELEKRRVESFGGVVTPNGRVLGQLAVSRAIGDFGLKPSVSSVPIITSNVWNANLYSSLVLACDGVFDVLEQSDIAKVINAKEEEGNELNSKMYAHKICKEALTRKTKDNVSVLCASLML